MNYARSTAFSLLLLVGGNALADVYLNSYQIRFQIETPPRRVTGVRGTLLGKFTQFDAMEARDYAIQNLRAKYPREGVNRELPFFASFDRITVSPAREVRREGPFGAQVVQQTRMFGGEVPARIPVLSDHPHGDSRSLVFRASVKVLYDFESPAVRVSLDHPDQLISDLKYEVTPDRLVKVTLPPRLRYQLGRHLRGSPRIRHATFVQLRVDLEFADGHVESLLLDAWSNFAMPEFRRAFYLSHDRYVRPAYYREFCADRLAATKSALE